MKNNKVVAKIPLEEINAIVEIVFPKQFWMPIQNSLFGK
jgi:hypothetical protein